MTKKKSAAQPPQLSIDRQRAAEQELKDAVDNAKRLKAKSREAKQKVKQAKKAAKEATKASREAKKAAAKARRAYKKLVARVSKKQKKAAKEREPIATPKRTTPSRNQPRSMKKRERRIERPGTGAGVWEVGEETVNPEVAESELDSDVPAAGA